MDEYLLTMRECYVHVHWHPHRLIAYLNMVPELGRFLHDHLQREVADYVRIVEESNPEWYTPYADCTLSFETSSAIGCGSSSKTHVTPISVNMESKPSMTRASRSAC